MVSHVILWFSIRKSNEDYELRLVEILIQNRTCFGYRTSGLTGRLRYHNIQFNLIITFDFPLDETFTEQNHCDKFSEKRSFLLKGLH